ncbi:MAG: tagaturonate epimerase family protein [Chloroflexota bacterium]
MVCWGGRVHLKTAGTSYLEALRAIASVDAALFRHVLDFSRERYEEDRRTYHVSARWDHVPAADNLSDGELLGLLDQFDARQCCT